jgi:membrane-associated phospholipid phosphatase
MRATSLADREEEPTVLPGRPALWLSLAGLAGFVALLVLVVVGTVDALDHHVEHVVDRHQVHAALTAARVLTDVLAPPVDAALLVVGAAMLSWRERNRRAFRTALVVLAAVAAAVLSVKYGVARPLPHSPSWAGGQGFPSGHTAATLALLGTLAELVAVRRPTATRALRTAVGVLTVLVAASLVYAGYHWLTDTLASVALGLGVLGLLRLQLTR